MVDDQTKERIELSWRLIQVTRQESDQLARQIEETQKMVEQSLMIIAKLDAIKWGED